MKAFKRAEILSVLLFMFFILSGCFFMMPLMMAPMANDYLKTTDPRVTVSVNGLMEEGVNDLVAHRGPFDQVMAGQTTVREDIFPQAKFRNLMFEQLRANGSLLILDQEKQPAASPAFSKNTGDSGMPPAVIHAQLYGTGDRLFLALQLVDSRSNQLFWSGLYSRDLPPKAAGT